MEKRYQVFVSSTFEDLQQERQEVMQALLELDCIPCGMELFSAADEDQWTLIKQVIDDSDYYILILDGRYGSVTQEGVSYTEMEYKYALSTNKPIIAFTHSNIEELPAKNVEQDPEKKEKLEKFKELVEQKVRKTWTSAADLGSVVSRAMIKLIKQHPAEGWVRARNIVSEDISKELLELKLENEELKSKLQQKLNSTPGNIEDLAQGDDPIKLSIPYKGYNSESKLIIVEDIKIETTWNQLFSIMAPCLLVEATEKKLKDYLYEYFGFKALDKIEEDAERKKLHSLKTGELIDFEFQKIMIQFKALGLIKKSEKKRSIKDSGNYWTLTEYGDSVMTHLVAIRKSDDPSL